MQQVKSCWVIERNKTNQQIDCRSNFCIFFCSLKTILNSNSTPTGCINTKSLLTTYHHYDILNKRWADKCNNKILIRFSNAFISGIINWTGMCGRQMHGRLLFYNFTLPYSYDSSQNSLWKWSVQLRTRTQTTTTKQHPTKKEQKKRRYDFRINHHLN